MRGNVFRQGFTLVELLVVLGIIALLMAILLPALQSVRAAAVTTRCLSQQRAIGQAFLLYENNNHGYLPLASYQNADDFVSGSPTYYTGWWNRYAIGQYLNIKTRGIGYNPSTTAEGYTGKVDPQTSHIFCAEYWPIKMSQKQAINEDLGYGVNTYQAAKVMGNKVTRIRRSVTVPLLVDVKAGMIWDKFYSQQPNTPSGSDNSLVLYRHNRGKATVVSFVDGHSELFLRNSAETVYGFKSGFYSAYLDKSINPLAAN